MAITAADVSALRKSTGAGMMDAKKALEEANGDMEAAAKILREKGMAGAAKRADRDNSQGAVSLVILNDSLGAVVELKCETDFVAKSAEFIALLEKMATSVAESGESAVAGYEAEIGVLAATLKEKIEVGRISRFEAPAGSVVDGYLHIQSDRGVNAVLVEIAGGTRSLAHDIALHIGFARPRFVTREEVPAEEVANERATLETISRNEGKPEAQIEKIVDGRLRGFYANICLLDQNFIRDEKQTIAQVLGSATVTRFSQIVIG